jgi:serine/threonine protein phosphatase 1
MMSTALSRLFTRRKDRFRVPVAELAPEGALWAVGDVHGCLTEYREIEARIVAGGLPATIVLLGDVVDRGPDSRGMLDLLTAPPTEGLTRLCLLGNHEDMMLAFLASPGANRAWLDFGGRETLRSYGCSHDGRDPPALAAALRDSMPAEHRRYLESLPVLALTPGFVLSHAGAAAETPLTAQRKADLVWARHGEVADLLPPADLGDRIVVHGHVPVPLLRQAGWRINLDTGAFATGRLSAARLSPGAAPVFMQSGPGG